MRNDKLSVQSMDFAASVINLVRYLKENKEHIISNQIGRSGTSIGSHRLPRTTAVLACHIPTLK